MNEAKRLRIVTDQTGLLDRILSYSIGPQDAALSFEARLARENGWPMEYTVRVIGEYKRFCYLAITADHHVTPSDPIDQAWHLHLTYSRDYWDHYCPHVLGKSLHHGPTEGGAHALHSHFNQYARTLESYSAVFGHAPPADIWPIAADGLIAAARARRVHPRDGIVIPPGWIMLAGALFLLLAAAFIILALYG